MGCSHHRRLGPFHHLLLHRPQVYRHLARPTRVPREPLYSLCHLSRSIEEAISDGHLMLSEFATPELIVKPDALTRMRPFIRYPYPKTTEASTSNRSLFLALIIFLIYRVFRPAPLTNRLSLSPIAPPHPYPFPLEVLLPHRRRPPPIFRRAIDIRQPSSLNFEGPP